MKKAALKTGMVIEFNNGVTGVVLKGTTNGNIVCGKGVWFPLDEKSNDLSLWEEEEGVSSVEDPDSNCDYQATGNYSLVWRKPADIPEYTMEELVKKVGFEFKIKRNV